MASAHLGSQGQLSKLHITLGCRRPCRSAESGELDTEAAYEKRESCRVELEQTTAKTHAVNSYYGSRLLLLLASRALDLTLPQSCMHAQCCGRLRRGGSGKLQAATRMLKHASRSETDQTADSEVQEQNTNRVSLEGRDGLEQGARGTLSEREPRIKLSGFKPRPSSIAILGGRLASARADPA